MAVTYDRTSIKVRVNGHFGTPGARTDYWSTGFHLAEITGGSVGNGDLVPFLTAISTAVATFHGTGTWGAGTNCYVDELTAAHIGTNGKYWSQAEQTARYTYPSPVPGTGNPIHPWNTAVVLSLRTTLPRGMGSNGRMYWPALAQTVASNTGRLANSQTSQMLIVAKTMLDAVNSAASSYQAGLKLHVLGYSAKTGQSISAPVRSIRMDQRLDSIERRENDQVPIWDSVNLV